jgi:hypothetical protein
MDKRMFYFIYDIYDIYTNCDKFYQMKFEQGERLWDLSTVLLPSWARF